MSYRFSPTYSASASAYAANPALSFNPLRVARQTIVALGFLLLVSFYSSQSVATSQSTTDNAASQNVTSSQESLMTK